MDHTTTLISELREYYHPDKYVIITGILEMLEGYSNYEALRDAIESYIDSMAGSRDGETIISYIDRLISSHVTADVIPADLGLIVDSTTVINMYLLSGLLCMRNKLGTFDPITSPEEISILSNLEYDDILKVGMLVNLHQSEYHPMDIYDSLLEVPVGIITTYQEVVNRAITMAKNEPTEVMEFFNNVNSINPDLIGTHVMGYLISTNSMDVDERNLISYINHLTDLAIIFERNVGRELLIFGLIFNKTLTDLVELAVSVFSELNTETIVSYLREQAGVLDEHNAVS
jgi:hypothetical protein